MPTYPGQETSAARSCTRPTTRVPTCCAASGCSSSVPATPAATSRSRAAQNATHAWHSTRRGYYYNPKYMTGRPSDQVADSLLALRLPLRRAPRAVQGVAGDRGRRPDEVRPARSPTTTSSRPTRSSTSSSSTTSARATSRPSDDIARFDADGVVFTDGSRIDVDLVVFCTGYLVTVPVPRAGVAQLAGRPPAAVPADVHAVVRQPRGERAHPARQRAVDAGALAGDPHRPRGRGTADETASGSTVPGSIARSSPTVASPPARSTRTRRGTTTRWRTRSTSRRCRTRSTSWRPRHERHVVRRRPGAAQDAGDASVGVVVPVAADQPPRGDLGPARRPTPGRPPLLMVHGIAHAAWCYDENWVPAAAAQGWPAYAVSLRGHGGSGGAGICARPRRATTCTTSCRPSSSCPSRRC